MQVQTITFGVTNKVTYTFAMSSSDIRIVVWFDFDGLRGRNYMLKTDEGIEVREQDPDRPHHAPIVLFKTSGTAQKLADKLNRALAKLPAFSTKPRVTRSSWLFEAAIATNVIKRYHRSRKRSPLLEAALLG